MISSEVIQAREIRRVLCYQWRVGEAFVDSWARRGGVLQAEGARTQLARQKSREKGLRLEWMQREQVVSGRRGRSWDSATTRIQQISIHRGRVRHHGLYLC